MNLVDKNTQTTDDACRMWERSTRFACGCSTNIRNRLSIKKLNEIDDLIFSNGNLIENLSNKSCACRDVPDRTRPMGKYSIPVNIEPFGAKLGKIPIIDECLQHGAKILAAVNLC